MHRRWLLIAGVLGIILATPLRAAADSARETYLALAKEAYRAARDSCPAAVQAWRESYKPTVEAGYLPPETPIWLSALAGSLYELTGEEDYAREAARWLAAQHEFKAAYPEELRQARPEYRDGLPTLANFFALPALCSAYRYIKDSPSLTAEQREQIERSVAESADFVRSFPEWGPMNRAMLRAEGLLLAAQALPNHPHAPLWRKLAQVLAADSWGHWTEEDAEIYHPIWLISLISYADLVPDRSLFDAHPIRYYCDYFVHLLSPAGMVVDFGDARWNENWADYLACFERAGREYRRGEYRWAANRVMTAMTALQKGPVSVRAGLAFADAYRWIDESTVPQEPPARSEEVLDEVIGKKVAFRSGWDDRATFLLLNYRDEGDFCRMARDYLRHTIPVEEEKAHHGHSDENSICLLMSQGSVLLHDAGYRERIPSGPYGAFRADYFHNRLVVRRAKREREQPLWEFLRYSGAYRPVTTEKIDFFTAADVDVSRTRLRDARAGYLADRVIVYLKQPEVFVVVDVVKLLEEDYYTFATLWHGTTVLSRGPGYYVTAVDAIGNYTPPGRRALLVDFLQGGTRESGTFPIRRHNQEETAVYQALASHYNPGHVETFVTVLVPHERGADVAPLVQSIRPLEVASSRDGVGVQLDLGGQTQYVCVKTDLNKEILTENVRPRYTYESGKVRYGPLETDASFLYAKLAGQQLSYVATHMVKVRFQDRAVFEAPANTFPSQPDDLSTGYGPPKWRYWEDTVAIK